MSFSLKAKDYDDTLGAILNYKFLSTFLLKEIKFTDYCNYILDAPCGTGALLKELKTLEPKLYYFGLDNSLEQIEIASRKLERKYLIHCDIFQISKIFNIFNIYNGFCHIGFSFFNILDPKKRFTLLQDIFICKSISILGFEIQNQNHQEKYYKIGVWYKTQLNNNTILKSKSEWISSNRKAIDLIFIKGEKTHSLREYLFCWKLDECIEDCKKIGWEIKYILPASYRDKFGNLNSHWFIVIEK